MTKQGGWPATGFGGRLRTLREAAGLTQQQLADAAECNRFTVAKLERGQQEPAWPLVLALCKALGVPCTEFTAVKVEAPVDTLPPAEPKPKGGKKPGGGKTKGK
jgi:DNA-binding XRE family transcriptional regulator